MGSDTHSIGIENPVTRNTQRTISFEDTIAAIATPPGVSALGIVRVSGPAAISMVQQAFESSRGKSLITQKSHTVCHGWIVREKHKIDEVMVAVYRSPASYTGEDIVEITGHGGYANMRSILAALLAFGARLAEPGEFTKRAFVNGKMDLAQAESVMDLIAAKSDEALHAGLARLQGGLSGWVRQLRQEILSYYALLEAAIDFPEEEIESLQIDQLKSRIQTSLKSVSDLLAGAEASKLARDGIKVMLLGRPNAGKSKLFNALLMEDRALVSATPGTTRDTLEESFLHKGFIFSITDTAGLRERAGKLEQAGIARTLEKAKDADVFLYLVDNSRALQKQDEKYLREHGQKEKTIVVFTKMDLPAKISRAEQQALAKDFSNCKVSAITAEGLALLKDLLLSLVQSSIPTVTASDMRATANERQRQALKRAQEALGNSLESCERAMSYEVIALDLSRALNYLGEITGETASDELLHAIFSRFCIGK